MSEETACAICAAYACLRDEDPSLVLVFEEAWECVALSPSVLSYRLIQRITCLVAWVCTCKSAARLYLRAEERCCRRRKLEACSLAEDHGRTLVSLRIHHVSESHVAVRYAEDHVKYRPVLLSECEYCLCSLVVHLALLDGLDAVLLLDELRSLFFRKQCHLRHIFAHTGVESQRRRKDECVSVIVYAVGRLTGIVVHNDLDPAVRAREGSLLCKALECGKKTRRCKNHFFHIIICLSYFQSSVLKGEARSPSLFMRFASSGLSAHA